MVFNIDISLIEQAGYITVHVFGNTECPKFTKVRTYKLFGMRMVGILIALLL